MSIIVCTGCGQKFGGDRHGESHDFDEHDCPATPDPIPGESWADYSARCEKAKAEYQARQG